MAVTRVTVAPGYWLAPAPAASYARARTDGMPEGITSAGRTWAEQEALWVKQGAQGLAAPPGSPTALHQKGIALDLPPEAEAWMRANGAAYGWSFPIPREHWHCVYDEASDTHLHPPTPATPTQEEDDMATTAYITQYPATSMIFVLSADLATKRHLHSSGEVAILKAGGAIENNGFTRETIDRALWTQCCQVK